VPDGLLISHTIPGDTVAAVELLDLTTGELITASAVGGGIDTVVVRG
jgi:hypothetical protein